MADFVKNKTSKIIISAMIILLCLGSFINTFYLTHKYGGTDLRCRIVGARLMAAQKSPYFYHWLPTDSITLLDPNYNGILNANGNVVTPAYLILLQPLSYLNYGVIRYVWTFLECLFLIAIILMLGYFSDDKKWYLNKFALITILIFFGCSDIWIFNIDRGQTYILYGFLLCFINLLFIKYGEKGKFFSGIIAGLFLFVRPLLAFNTLAYLTTKNKKYFAGLLIGALLGLAFFVYGKIAMWQDYFTAMKEYSMENVVFRNNHPFTHVLINHPTIIEGTNNLNAWRSNFKIASLLTLQTYARGLKLYLSPSFLVFASLFFSIVLSGWFYVKKYYLSTYRLSLFACLLYLLAELFLIGSRIPYNTIQWIFPVYLLLNKNKLSSYTTAITMFALFQLLEFPFAFPFQELIGEGLLYSVIFYEIFFSKNYSFETALHNSNYCYK